jgi:hypothetical protein
MSHAVYPKTIIFIPQQTQLGWWNHKYVMGSARSTRERSENYVENCRRKNMNEIK